MPDMSNNEMARDIENVAAGLVSSSAADATEIDEDSLVNDVNRQQMLVKYLGDSVKFAEQIRIAIPLVCSLLYSQSVTDAQEAIDFFVAAYRFGVQGSIIGIRKMIVLIFSREKGVKDAVVAAYKQVYLESPELEALSARNKDIAVVKSLIELIVGASLGELISFEEMLKCLLTSGDVNKDHTKVLFEIYAQKIPGTTDIESRASVQILAMLAGSNRNIIRDNIDTFVSVGLAAKETSDYLMVQYTCSALQKAVDDVPKTDTAQPCYRFVQNHPICLRLQDIMVSGLINMSDDYWLPMSVEAVKVIYKLCEHPDLICESVLKDMIKEMLPLIRCSTPSAKSVHDDGDSQTSSSTQQSQIPEKDLNSEVLTRFITFIGNICLNQLIHMESNISTEIKIRRALKEAKEITSNKQFKTTTKTPRSKGRRSTISGTPGENAEEEMGMAGAAAVEDSEAEAILQMCNDEMVESKFCLIG